MRSVIRLVLALAVVAGTCGCTQTIGGAASGVAATTAARPTTGAAADPSSAAATPTASAGTTDADVLGPFGWTPPAGDTDPVVIGMDAATAAASGFFTATPSPTDTCVEWTAKPSLSIETVYVSPTIGVAAITARAGTKIHTPEGVTPGSTAAAVRVAYPDVDPATLNEPEGALVPTPANSKANYRFTLDASGKVDALSLESISQDCFG